jgi:intracellular sulfur oxidation DsrE/DsrF family protein
MKNALLVFACILSGYLFAQERQFPVVPNYGGVFQIDNAALLPDPKLKYNIVMDIAMASEKADDLNFAINNVARLLNLHALAGIPRENVHVVVAIHGEAAYCLMNNEAYQKKYKVNNPNLPLLKALKEAGVELYVCGQSLFARNIDRNTLSPDVTVALSMLTTVTTYQLKGYAFLKY